MGRLGKIAILNLGNIGVSFDADEDHSTNEAKREEDQKEQDRASTRLKRCFLFGSLP